MKNNKKGFTLVELLAVIAIMAILATIATPAVISIANKIRSNMYDAKIKMIIESAKLYGQANPTITEITVKGLVDEGYIIEDKRNKNESSSISIFNPKDRKSMDNCKVTLTKSNGRVKATYDTTDYNGSSC